MFITFCSTITSHLIMLPYIMLHRVALKLLNCIITLLTIKICHWNTLHCITLHYITLHYMTLHYITLHYITLHYITSPLHYLTLPWTSLDTSLYTLCYIALHYYTITRHYITLHCISLPWTSALIVTALQDALLGGYRRGQKYSLSLVLLVAPSESKMRFCSVGTKKAS